MNRKLTNSLLLITVSLSLLTIISGCVSVTAKCPESKFTSRGIPNSKYIVAGGAEINYQALKMGTFYYVDQRSQKIFLSRHTRTGIIFNSTTESATELLKKYNASLSSTNLVLYFVPD